MARPQLPTSVSAFIRDHIQSVTQIEILSLVQTMPQREWTVHAIDQTLRSNEQYVMAQLAAFADAGLFAKVDGSNLAYRYAPRTKALAAAAADTVQAYRTTPVLVIEAIFKT